MTEDAGTNELTTAIDKIITEKTFSLEAVEAIKALRTRAAELEKNLNHRSRKCDDSEREVAIQKGQISVLTVEIEAWKKREDSLKARENAVAENEKQMAVAKSESSTFREVFQTIFKNVIVREKVLDSVSKTGTGGGGGMYVNENHSQTTNRETTKE